MQRATSAGIGSFDGQSEAVPSQRPVQMMHLDSVNTTIVIGFQHDVDTIPWLVAAHSRQVDVFHIDNIFLTQVSDMIKSCGMRQMLVKPFNIGN